MSLAKNSRLLESGLVSQSLSREIILMSLIWLGIKSRSQGLFFRNLMETKGKLRTEMTTKTWDLILRSKSGLERPSTRGQDSLLQKWERTQKWSPERDQRRKRFKDLKKSWRPKLSGTILKDPFLMKDAKLHMRDIILHTMTTIIGIDMHLIIMREEVQPRRLLTLISIKRLKRMANKSSEMVQDLTMKKPKLMLTK